MDIPYIVGGACFTIGLQSRHHAFFNTLLVSFMLPFDIQNLDFRDNAADPKQ